jgi:uncharacterized protein (DUF849 family)
MNPNVIITCALTGAGDTVDKHPAIPVTPTQIAAAAVEAAKAGPPWCTAMCATRTVARAAATRRCTAR